MRTSPQMKLDAIQHAPTRKILAAILSQMREFSGALSKSVETGQTPAAIPVPTSPLEPPSDGTLPTPTTGTLLRGTSVGTWENLALGAAGSVLTVTGGNAAWQPVTLTNELLDGSNHTDTVAGSEVRGDLIVRNATSQWARFGIGGAGTVLTSNGTDPAWTAPATQTNILLDGSSHTDTLNGAVQAGDVIYGNNTPKWARLAKGTSKQVLAMNSGATLPEWASLDNTYLADRTRTVFVGVGEFYDQATGAAGLGGGTPVGTFPDSYIYYPLNAATNTQMIGVMNVPSDYVSGVRWNLVCGTDGTSTNNFRIVFSHLAIPSGTTGTAAATVSTTALLAGFASANRITYYDLGVAFTGLTAGSLVRLAIERTPGHASDTNPDNMHFLGLQLEYTADM